MSDDYEAIREAQARTAAQSLGADLATPPTPFADQADPVEVDIRTIVAEQIKDALGGMVAPPQSFEEALGDVDPADSEAALAMLDFLLKTGRLQRIGVLDGGNGYLFGYVEPKGSTKQGYRPGGTQGDRIVDEALEAQRNSNAPRPSRQGICPGCMSAVAEVGGVILGENGESDCPSGGKHGLA